MADAVIRQRSAVASNSSDRINSRHNPVSSEIDDTGRTISVLDILRVALTLLCASCAFSYYLTSGDSFTWNYKPSILKPGALSRYLKGPITLTPAELLLYTGSSSGLPIYLSINHTIFDVSASPHTYGPGGSYHVFAGRDATRAFVTGCFADDSTSDLRGAEDIYIPIDPTPGEDADLDAEEASLSNAEKKMRAERERREARKRVRKEVEKWEQFYRASAKYFVVGKLVGIGPYEGSPPKLCDSAQNGRPKRKKQKGKKTSIERSAALGKPVH